MNVPDFAPAIFDAYAEADRKRVDAYQKSAADFDTQMRVARPKIDDAVYAIEKIAYAMQNLGLQSGARLAELAETIAGVFAGLDAAYNEGSTRSVRASITAGEAFIGATLKALIDTPKGTS
jgi:hypothetical protein